MAVSCSAAALDLLPVRWWTEREAGLLAHVDRLGRPSSRRCPWQRPRPARPFWWAATMMRLAWSALVRKTAFSTSTTNSRGVKSSSSEDHLVELRPLHLEAQLWCALRVNFGAWTVHLGAAAPPRQAARRSGAGGGKAAAGDGAQLVDGRARIVARVVPERPAVAGVQPLHQRTDAVDGAGVRRRPARCRRRAPRPRGARGRR